MQRGSNGLLSGDGRHILPQASTAQVQSDRDTLDGLHENGTHKGLCLQTLPTPDDLLVDLLVRATDLAPAAAALQCCAAAA